MSNQAQPSQEEPANEQEQANVNQPAEAATDYPEPESPEGKARAGRLYFALIVAFFIFLGTIIAIYMLDAKVFQKLQITKITFFPVAQEATTDAPPQPAPMDGAPPQGQP